jgi:hypothetical protein
MEVFFEATQKNDLTSIQTYLLYPQVYKNINHQTPQDGFSALLWAAYYGHEAVVALLLDHDANIDILDNGNFAPLHYAAIANHKNVVELLLKRGANVDITNDVGRTPLHWVSFYEREDVIRMLLEWGADASIQDKDGFEALQLVPILQRRTFARIFQEHEETTLKSKPKLGDNEKDGALTISLKDEEDVEEELYDIKAVATDLKRKRFSQASQDDQASHLSDGEDEFTFCSSTASVGETSEATNSSCEQHSSPNPTSQHSSSMNFRTGLTMKTRIMTLASLLRIKLPQMSEQESDHPQLNYLPQHVHNHHLISLDDSESDDDRYEQHVRTLEKSLHTGTKMKSMKERIEWLEEELGVC